MIATMQLEDGTRVEAFFHASEGVKIGDTVDFETDEGVMVRGTRVPDTGHHTAVVCRDTAFVSTQPPKWDPRCKRHTKEGYAAFANQKEKLEYISRVNADNERAGNGMNLKTT